MWFVLFNASLSPYRIKQTQLTLGVWLPQCRLRYQSGDSYTCRLSRALTTRELPLQLCSQSYIFKTRRSIMGRSIVICVDYQYVIICAILRLEMDSMSHCLEMKPALPVIGALELFLNFCITIIKTNKLSWDILWNILSVHITFLTIPLNVRKCTR